MPSTTKPLTSFYLTALKKNAAKCIFLFGAILLLPLYIQGQHQKECNCTDALNEVSQVIKKSKSYKVLVRSKADVQNLLSWKKQIENEIKKDSLINYFCAGYLQKYISFIKDNHNKVFIDFAKNIPKIPSYKNVIDTLSNQNDFNVGFYFAGQTKIFLHKENDSTYLGIITKANSKIWKKGDIRLKLNRLKNGKFELFEFHKTGLLFYKNNIQITDNRIGKTFWNKDDNYYFFKEYKENFSFQSLSPSFDYIGIKTLLGSTKVRNEAKSFVASLESQLNKENIIIDLRNNTGGTTEIIKPIIQLLKDNTRIKNIYTIINYRTGSAAELGTLLLKKDYRTQIVGENSSGAIAFGYGERSISGTIPCMEGLRYSFTKKTTNLKFIKYEFSGIAPDIKLHNKKDWVEQIMSL